MKLLRLMRKMMIPIFAKFVAKRRHRNAQHVTSICAQIACTSIPVILMSLSSHLFIHMAVSCGKYILRCDHRGQLFGTTIQFGNVQYFSTVFAMCMCASTEVGGFRGGRGEVELLFGAVRCANMPNAESSQSLPEQKM